MAHIRGFGGNMSMGSLNRRTALGWLPVLVAAWPMISGAQAPASPLLSSAELQDLVGPIALYPDDLLAIVLPASTYPLQLVQAQRFLDDLGNDSSLQPDESWDDSIVALINYPEAVELLNDDLDWTWRLGEAVVAQQADVIDAVETFRDRAYAAGNLKSDAYQTISEDNGVIEITPVSDDVIYVPYYEPERVVVYQSRPAYYYYPDPYPVYYYPYPAGYAFNHGFFWGVTTAFTIGWYSDNLHVYHHSYYGHPYYGHSYWNHYWYRQPNIHAYNSHYNHYSGYSNSGHQSGHGDYWQPHSGNTFRSSDHRVTRNRYYPGTSSESRSERTQTTVKRPDIKFRDRRATPTTRHESIKLAQVRPSQTRTRQSEPSQARSSRSESRQTRSSNSRSKQKHTSQSRPSQSRTSQSQPRQSHTSQSRPSQPRESNSRASDSRASSSRNSRKSASVSHDRRSSSLSRH
jgi:hypothetical protein